MNIHLIWLGVLMFLLLVALVIYIRHRRSRHVIDIEPNDNVSVMEDITIQGNIVGNTSR